jgi:TRAP-type C4-dicarboxylate transport system permease small subunit
MPEKITSKLLFKTMGMLGKKLTMKEKGQLAVDFFTRSSNEIGKKYGGLISERLSAKEKKEYKKLGVVA